MSDHAQTFIAHLSSLVDRDRGALAVLRRSLSFDLGAFPAAMECVLASARGLRLTISFNQARANSIVAPTIQNSPIKG